MKHIHVRILAVLFSAVCLLQCDPPTPNASASNGPLYLNATGNGYNDFSGKAVIPAGKYAMCFSDTFFNYAIVQTLGGQFVLIDRQGKERYTIFNFDNGPDYPSDGLFRIVDQGKIGYADVKTYQVAIPARFTCAYPFENGVAKVSTDCSTKPDGEHQVWESEHWQYIDKTGKETTAPAPQ